MEIHEGSQIELTAEEYDSLYAGGSIPGAGLFSPVWDIGRPQPLVLDWHRQGVINSPVLDVGCGPGHNAIYLAQQGYQVTGVDTSSAALSQAQVRAGRLGLTQGQLKFVEADATDLTAQSHGRYRTIIDSAFYHCLNVAKRRLYVESLAQICSPGAVLLLACVSDEHPAMPGPFRVSQANLHSTLEPAGWEITSITSGAYESHWTRELMEGSIEAGALQPLDTAALDLTSDGRVRAPVWLVKAHKTAT